MKQIIITGLCIMAISITGCAKSLPPHEEINLAVKKSLDASGFNYTSKSRITNLSLPKKDQNSAPDDKKMKYLESGLDIVRGFSVNIDGAIDLKGKKSEVLYDLRYNKDNVDISIKMPLLMDYNSQTIYIGTSFLHTILDIATPQSLETKGKLIRIPLGELLKEGKAGSAELSKLLGDDRFSPKTMDIFNRIFKNSIMKAVAKLDDSRFSDQVLSELDKKAGIERRIKIDLGHNESVAVVVDLIDSVSKSLFDEGIISKSEYAVLLTFTDKKMLDELVKKITLTMVSDVGIAKSGYVGYLESRLNVADKDGNFQFGFESISSMNSYNEPRFSIKPEAVGTVDFSEVLKAIPAPKPKKKGSETPPAAQEQQENTEEPAPSDPGAKPRE